jgi:hypothetical protein
MVLPTPDRAVEAALAIGARTFLWVVPCLVYLVRVHGRCWASPLGLAFPYGKSQVLRVIIVPVVVALLLVFGTAHQLGVAPSALLGVLVDRPQPRLTAPVFE